MTIQGAIAELQNLLEVDDVPFYYKGGIEKVIETIQMELADRSEDRIMETSTLKSCPFCGSEVFVDKVPMWSSYNGTTHGYFGCYEFDIHCTDPECGCQIKLGKNNTIYRDEKEARANAIKAWNRRADDGKVF